jgi:hypothetical protein
MIIEEITECSVAITEASGENQRVEPARSQAVQTSTATLVAVQDGSEKTLTLESVPDEIIILIIRYFPVPILFGPFAGRYFSNDLCVLARIKKFSKFAIEGISEGIAVTPTRGWGVEGNERTNPRYPALVEHFRRPGPHNYFNKCILYTDLAPWALIRVWTVSRPFRFLPT